MNATQPTSLEEPGILLVQYRDGDPLHLTADDAICVARAKPIGPALAPHAPHPQAAMLAALCPALYGFLTALSSGQWPSNEARTRALLGSVRHVASSSAEDDAAPRLAIMERAVTTICVPHMALSACAVGEELGLRLDELRSAADALAKAPTADALTAVARHALEAVEVSSRAVRAAEASSTADMPWPAPGDTPEQLMDRQRTGALREEALDESEEVRRVTLWHYLVAGLRSTASGAAQAFGRADMAPGARATTLGSVGAVPARWNSAALSGAADALAEACLVGRRAGS